MSISCVGPSLLSSMAKSSSAVSSVMIGFASSNCLHAHVTREELLGLTKGTLVAHVRLRPVASLGLRLGLTTRDN